MFRIRIWAGKIDTNALSIDMTKCDAVYEILQKNVFLIMIMIMKNIENP